MNQKIAQAYERDHNRAIFTDLYEISQLIFYFDVSFWSDGNKQWDFVFATTLHSVAHWMFLSLFFFDKLPIIAYTHADTKHKEAAFDHGGYGWGTTSTAAFHIASPCLLSLVQMPVQLAYIVFGNVFYFAAHARSRCLFTALSTQNIEIYWIFSYCVVAKCACMYKRCGCIIFDTSAKHRLYYVCGNVFQFQFTAEQVFSFLCFKHRCVRAKHLHLECDRLH